MHSCKMEFFFLLTMLNPFFTGNSFSKQDPTITQSRHPDFAAL